MSDSDIDPVVDLVRQAMGYGVLMALEDREGLRRKLAALGPTANFPEALIEDAQGFVNMRDDLVEKAIRVGPLDEYRGQ